MKKLFLILAAACLFFACSNQKSFKISGTITDFGNPDVSTMLYLKTRVANEELLSIDSTYLSKDGSFILKGKSSETDLYFIADRDNVFFLRIFVEPGDIITVSGNAYDIANINIEGSETQKLYDDYLALLTPFQEKQMEIEQKFYAFMQNANINENELQQIQTELIVDYEQWEDRITATTLDFIGDHANSIVAAYLVFRNTNNSSVSAEIEEQLQLLNPKMDNKFVKSVKDRIEKVQQTEVGVVLPTIELPDPEGTHISLESLRGKYVLVDFWASWCRPCVAEIPNLKNAYKKYHEKGFEIYSISLDESREAWLNGIAKHEMNWLNVSDVQGFNSPVAKQLAVSYVPHTFLIDPQGVILAVDLREDALENILADKMK
jgi:peroxiredoxin